MKTTTAALTITTTQDAHDFIAHERETNDSTRSRAARFGAIADAFTRWAVDAGSIADQTRLRAIAGLLKDAQREERARVPPVNPAADD